MNAESLALFIDAWPLFRDSVLAAAIAGGVLGLVGVYVVLRRMVFLSAALSQCAGLGVALAFLAQVHLGISGAVASPFVGATVASLALVALLLLDRSGDAARRDAYLGIAFLVGSAGTLVVGTRIVAEVNDIESLLFGTAVAVLPDDLARLATVGAFVVALHLWWRRGFVAVVVDAVDAQVRGIPVRVVEGVLLASIAVGISVTTQILGALPAFAFSVLPAIFAIALARTVGAALMISAAVGIACGVGGYYLAFTWDLPVGATQTLVACVFAAAAGIIAKRR